VEQWHSDTAGGNAKGYSLVWQKSATGSSDPTPTLFLLYTWSLCLHKTCTQIIVKALLIINPKLENNLNAFWWVKRQSKIITRILLNERTQVNSRSSFLKNMIFFSGNRKWRSSRRHKHFIKVKIKYALQNSYKHSSWWGSPNTVSEC
jgi:hypothetical protein